MSSQAIETYINQFSGNCFDKLNAMRAHIKSLVPEAEEVISYAMPTFKLKGQILVHYAGYAHHIGFYAIPNTHEAFADALKGYKQGKGSVQFPLAQPLPLELITEMVKHRVEVVLQGKS
jgi:uncharacterized protein YdhG (YjbR/CyaY superfamily)